MTGERRGDERRTRDRLARVVEDWVARHVPELMLGVAGRLRAVRLVGAAAEVAFFAALAVVPMTLAVLGTLTTLVGEQGTAAVVRSIRLGIELTLAGRAEEGVMRSVNRLVAGPAPGLVSISIGGLLLFASRGFVGVLRGLSLMYGTVGQRPWWRERVVALGLTVAAVAVLAFGLAAFVLGPLLGRGLGLADDVGFVVLARGTWRVLRWIVLPGAVAVFLTILYHYARGRRGHWTRDLPGALGATAGLGLLAVGYRYFLAVTPRLGSLPAGGEEDVVGTVLVGLLSFLVLLAIAGAVVLVGGAFNAEYDPDVPTVDPEHVPGAATGDAAQASR